jgi:uncharacterized membrane protein YecN with MAPEG domain
MQTRSRKGGVTVSGRFTLYLCGNNIPVSYRSERRTGMSLLWIILIVILILALLGFFSRGRW